MLEDRATDALCITHLCKIPRYCGRLVHAHKLQAGGKFDGLDQVQACDDDDSMNDG